VFARVSPPDKVRIVAAYQRAGLPVAMTGDGANDAAAIRLADVGLALGERCTPAARDAADIVIADGRVETIVDAIIEGRALWAAVRDAIAILLGGNLGEVVFTAGTTVLTGRSPLNARQLLLVNLLTDIAPALTIAVRQPTGRTPQQLAAEGPELSLGAPLRRKIALRAVTTASGAAAAWSIASTTGRPRRASTTALVALVGTQLGQTIASSWTDPLTVGVALGSAALLCATVQTPVVSSLFGCVPLGPVAWATAVGSASAATAAGVMIPIALRRLR
ncbi:MAG: cation-translocating P-type ATPase, partial [Actinomycetota bacterium]|nr:cation-translocating P-type ATPase [Actinomycetota bacterium]